MSNESKRGTFSIGDKFRLKKKKKLVEGNAENSSNVVELNSDASSSKERACSTGMLSSRQIDRIRSGILEQETRIVRIESRESQEAYLILKDLLLNDVPNSHPVFESSDKRRLKEKNSSYDKSISTDSFSILKDLVLSESEKNDIGIFHINKQSSPADSHSRVCKICFQQLSNEEDRTRHIFKCLGVDYESPIEVDSSISSNPVQTLISHCPMCNMEIPKDWTEELLQNHVNSCLEEAVLDL